MATSNGLDKLKKAATATAAWAQADLNRLANQSAAQAARQRDFNERLQEVQAKQRFGSDWPAPANRAGDDMEQRIDSPQTITNNYYPSAPAAAQSSGLMDLAKKAAIAVSLLGGGAAAGWGVPALLALRNKPQPAVQAPAAAPTPTINGKDYRLELVPEQVP